MGDAASSVLAAVIAERSFGKDVSENWQEFASEVVGNTESVVPAMRRLLALRPYVLVVYGGDRLVSRILTAYHTQLRHNGYPLRLLPLAAGDLQFVARAAGVQQTPARVAKALREQKDLQNWPSRVVSCLKVSSSMEPAAQYGFSFGAGWPYTAFHVYERKREQTPGGAGVSIAAAAASLAKDWARSGVGLRGAEAARAKNRVSVDYKSRGESVSYVMASTLEESWFGGTATRGNQASLVMGDSPVELLKRAAVSRTLPGSLSSRQKRAKAQASEGFERAHLDGFEGYVLDGILFKPEHPYVVQVSQGPQVHLIGSAAGRLSRITGLLSRPV